MYRRETVVVATDPFGATPRRPYLVVSDDGHPFAGEQYIAVGISTQEYEQSVPLAGAFVEGSLDRASFVAPWAVVSLREANIERAVARVDESTMESVVSRLADFVGYWAP